MYSPDVYSALKVLHHPERLAELRAGRQPVPTQVHLVISDLCNQDCPWCSYRSENYPSSKLFAIVDETTGERTHNPARFIPREKVLELLDDFSEMGISAVQFTGGGEPTVHPDHADLFEATLARGLELALVTNGARLSDRVVELLAGATWLRISLDAGCPETYAATRRVSPQVYGRVLDNVSRLRVARDRSVQLSPSRVAAVLGVGFVVHRHNYREVVQAAKDAQAAGADNFRISALFQSDDARYFVDFYEEARDLCRQADLLSRPGFRVYNRFGDRIEDLVQQNPNYKLCGYQHFCTYIGGDQNVYRCCVYSYNERGLLGSIKNRRFRDLWASSEKEADFDRFDARGCERCMFNDKNRVINYALDESPAHVNFV